VSLSCLGVGEVEGDESAVKDDRAHGGGVTHPTILKNPCVVLRRFSIHNLAD